MRKTRDYKGITLVALIITIIVLVILTVVTIRAVTGDGIIQYAQNVREEYIMGQEEEKQLLDSYMTHLEENISETPYIAHNDKIPLGGKYITANGETLETTENNYVSFPNTVLDSDRYIYGDYEYRYNEYYYGGGSTPSWRKDTTQNGWGVRVKDNDISKTSYGNILTTINKKDITSLTGTFFGCETMKVAPAIPKTVTSLFGTFYRCKAITNAPSIPDRVTDMRMTFQECIGLTKTPYLPETVKDMLQTFFGCSNLVSVTNLPKQVENLKLTFKNCDLLKDVPDIPNAVTVMAATFDGCTSLVNAPKIAQGVVDMQQAFYNCTSLVIAPEIPNSVTNMKNTFLNCTSLVTAPKIPNSVTNMSYTFADCTSLTGTIVINVTEFKGDGTYPKGYECCFYGTEKDIVITSDEGVDNKSILNALDGTTAKSSTKNNITVQKD